MAPWVDAKLFLAIFFITCYCTVTLAQLPMDCCLSVAKKPIDKTILADYRQQLHGQGCPIDATVFVSRRGKKLCAPLDEKWVHDRIQHLDQLKEKCKLLKYKGQRCFGLKPE